MATYYAYSADENWWAAILKQSDSDDPMDDWFTTTLGLRMFSYAAFVFEKESDATLFKLTWM
jgi:hypothetical protein